ncbi:MAG: LPXTG cell wall anchor domain-containing protein, partial [Clostridiaceae bacterium]|nr:LPXTG cell wall anchor domain-containing protein [Clostridiaceae bacterium]
GDFTLGLMEFEDVGTYVYEISELASSSERFEIDKTRYTMTITITLVDYFLKKEVIVKKAGGEVVSAMTFTNKYHPVPKTGENSLASLQGAGLMLLAAALVVVQQKNKKRYQKKQK